MPYLKINLPLALWWPYFTIDHLGPFVIALAIIAIILRWLLNVLGYWTTPPFASPTAIDVIFIHLASWVDFVWIHCPPGYRQVELIRFISVLTGWVDLITTVVVDGALPVITLNTRRECRFRSTLIPVVIITTTFDLHVIWNVDKSIVTHVQCVLLSIGADT